MAETRRDVRDVIFEFVILPAIVVGIFWLGTIYTHSAIVEARNYDRAVPCAGSVSTNCLSTVPAQIVRRVRKMDESYYVFLITVRSTDRSEQLSSSSSMFEATHVGQDVELVRFNGRTVGLRAGDQYFGDIDDPEPPYLSGLLGVLFWAALFALAGGGLMNVLLRSDERLLNWWAYFACVCFAVAVGIIVVGFLGAMFDVLRIDARLVYVSLVLTPAAMVLGVCWAALVWCWRSLAMRRPQVIPQLPPQ